MSIYSWWLVHRHMTPFGTDFHSHVRLLRPAKRQTNNERRVKGTAGGTKAHGATVGHQQTWYGFASEAAHRRGLANKRDHTAGQTGDYAMSSKPSANTAKTANAKSKTQTNHEGAASADKTMTDDKKAAPARSGHMGLDLGTSRIVLASTQGDRTHYKTELNAFVSMPYSKMTKAMLERENIHHTQSGSEILAFGNRVDEFANILGGDTRRPMQTGVLNPNEPRNLEMLALALTNLCGPAQNGEKICFSVPSSASGSDADVIYHEQSIRKVLEDLGYEVHSLNEALAVVIAELKDHDFTGIGMSFGAGMCNVCVAYLGLPVVAFSTTRAGDYIDYSASSVTGETPTTVRLAKESEEFKLNGKARNSIDQAVSVYYRDIIQTVVLTLERILNNNKQLPPFRGPIPVVFGGGTSMVEGFHEELRKAFAKVNLPIEIMDVRKAKYGMNTTATGALVAALADM